MKIRSKLIGGLIMPVVLLVLIGVLEIAPTNKALNERTQQIGEITNAVSTLAEQSKMLALNTSIEATKAGDAGKGFSGVTAEVRDLAKSSQQSTVNV